MANGSTPSLQLVFKVSLAHAVQSATPLASSQWPQQPAPAADVKRNTEEVAVVDEGADLLDIIGGAGTQ